MQPLASASALTGLLDAQGHFDLAIWDFDGVIADSEPAQAKAYKVTLEKAGVTPPEDFFEDLAGRSESEIWTLLQQAYELPKDTRSLSADRVEQLQHLLIERIAPNWFVTPMLDYFDQSGTPNMMVSSGNMSVIKPYLQRWGLAARFVEPRSAVADFPPLANKEKQLTVAVERVTTAVVFEDSARYLALSRQLGAFTVAVVHDVNEQQRLEANVVLTAGAAK